MPDIHGGGEPGAKQMPRGNMLGDNFDIIPGPRREDEGGVEQKDGPCQHNPDHVNIRASVTLLGGIIHIIVIQFMITNVYHLIQLMNNLFKS